MQQLIAAACLMVGGWLVFISSRAVMHGIHSRSWPKTKGVVASIRVVKSQNSEGDDVWRDEIEYTYSVGTATYRCKRYQFGIPRTLTWSAKSTGLRKGSSVEISYDPKRPSVAVLHRGFSPFALLTAAAGGAILWIGSRLLF